MIDYYDLHMGKKDRFERVSSSVSFWDSKRRNPMVFESPESNSAGPDHHGEICED